MARVAFLFTLLVALAVSGAVGDYLQIIGWTDQTTTSCSTLLGGNYVKTFNIETPSDMSTCITMSAAFNLYAKVECTSPGTAHMTFYYNDECDPDIGQPPFTPITKASDWLVPQCWSGNQAPQPLTALHAMCFEGNIPSPAVPVAAPVTAPTTQAPESTSTPTTTVPTPAVSNPTSAPTPVSTTPTPVSTTPVPQSAPTPPPNNDPIVASIVQMTASFGPSCSIPGPSANASGDGATACVALGAGIYMAPACTPTGWAYGFTCFDSMCIDCIPWAGNIDQPDRDTWNEVRCVNTSAPGFSAKCIPLRESHFPPAPVYIAPPPVPIAPMAPSSTPTPIAPYVTVDWSAEFGTTCGAPSLFGSFNNLTSCQTVYSNSAYAVAYCTPEGVPKGKICTVASCNSDTACTPFTATSSTTWGQSVCVATPQKLAISLTCNNHTSTPPPQPVAPVTPAPPPVSSGGPVTFTAYMDPGCQRQIQAIKLVANISQCQRVSAIGQVLYMKADCFANGTIHGAMCNKDSDCKSCTPLPPAPQDLCVPFTGFNLVSAIMVDCPVINTPGSSPSNSPRSNSPGSNSPTNSAPDSLRLSALLLAVISAVPLFFL